MILRPTLARAASLGLFAIAASSLGACSASVSTETKAPREDQSWEEPAAAGPARGAAQRNVSGRPPTATFPAFHVVGEERTKSVVGVEVSRDVTVTEQKSEGRLIFVLSDTNVPEKVNRLPLVADNFGTAVSKVYLVQAGNDAHLIIELRSAVQHTHRVVQTDNGINVEVSITGEPYGRPTLVAPGPDGY